MRRSTSYNYALVRAVAVGLAVLFVAVLPPGARPAGASHTPDSTPFVNVSGHGWGHGRGLGQYGAFGYAEESGWSAGQILDHFYGNTTVGQAAQAASPIDPANLRVEIRGNRAQSLRVNLQVGTMLVTDLAGTPLLETGDTIRISSVGAGLQVETAASCSGPWTLFADYALDAVQVIATSGAEGSDGLLRVCKPDGTSTWYEGAIRSHNVGGSTRVVNVVPVETYLRGVVPNEVPASWPASALQAQAVAARSYVMAGDSRQLPYADTCDTILCQVYQGRYRQDATKTPSFFSSTDGNTDGAVAATAGQIRLFANGAIARTEFSSSTGGYTVGGDFPAVVDEGDDIAANPNHDWTATVDLGSFEQGQGKGHLLAIRITERNGLGQDGGRVEQVAFDFEQGTVTMTGNEARRMMGLKSDWFSVGPIERAFENTPAAAYISHVYRLFLGRAASPAEQSQWLADVEGGRYHVLTDGLAVSDEWAGVVVDDLYQSALDRPADAVGRQYWVGQIADGVRVEDIGALFYGSAEYYQAAGGTHEGFVSALFADLLERQPDGNGLAFWANELASGRRTSGEVASGFYASIESRRSRVTGLYQRILDRDPEAGGLEFWAQRLLTTDDVRLASELAASEESFDISQG